MILILFALLLAWTPAETHQSKPEEPSSSKAYKTEDTKSAPVMAKLSSAITELPAQTTQNTTNNQQQSAIEKWLGPSTLPNWVIALITLSYVGVSIGQLIALRRQAKFARRTLRAIRRQAEVAANTLGAIERQAEIAAKGVEVNRMAANAAQKSAEVARLALTAERPCVLVEEVKFQRFGKAPRPLDLGSMVPPDNPVPKNVAVTVMFRNYGKGVARIDELVGSLRVIDPWPQPRDYSDCAELAVTREVLGSNRSFRSQMMFASDISENDRELIRQGKKRLVVNGRLQYLNLADRKYVSGFCWELDFTLAILAPGVEPMARRGPKTHNYDEEENASPN